jgi:hypothetical protein
MREIFIEQHFHGINEPLDLRDGKPRIVFVNEVKRLAGIVAVDDRVRQNACAAHDRPSRYFAASAFLVRLQVSSLLLHPAT